MTRVRDLERQAQHRHVVRYTAVYEPVEDGWIQARLLELPGVITAAPTQPEAEELLLDALQEYLTSLQDEVIPAQRSSSDEGHQIELAISLKSA